MNGLANVIRGTGNMLVPALVVCVGVAVLVPLSPVLIFGLRPLPALGIAGGGVALIVFYAAGSAVMVWYVLSGRNVARLRLSRLRWSFFRSILNVGGGCVNNFSSNERHHRACDCIGRYRRGRWCRSRLRHRRAT